MTNGLNGGHDSCRYYMSVYMQAPDVTALTIERHDQCVSLWKCERGAVVLQRYWELERVTGIKHHSLPLRYESDLKQFLNSLLAEEELTLDDVAEVWGTPHLQTDSKYVELVGEGESVHSTSHLYSAIGLDWEIFREAKILGLALDAGPDLQLEQRLPKYAYSGCIVTKGSVRTFPIESPAVVWQLARGRFMKEEGSLMALLSATTCAVSAEVESLLDGLQFWTQSDVFASGEILLDRITSFVEDCLSTEEGMVRNGYDDRFSREENVTSAIMKLVDRACHVIVDRNIEWARDTYELDLASMHLALAGGYALNCPGNSRLMEKYSFKSLVAPPCVNDGGQALGIGLMALHRLGYTRNWNFRLGNAFYGTDAPDVEEALNRFGAAVESVDEMDLRQVVRDIIESPVAWVQGASEIGPRALGHRSILGDPRTSRTKGILNDVKCREWWRPVAPIVLESEVHRWFEEDRSSPYMLEVFRSRSAVRDEVPAVLHLDTTARVQTVSEETDPLMASLLVEFSRETGVPILANTSLNDRGEPIVNTVKQAVNFCIRKGVGILYANGLRIKLRVDADSITRLNGPESRDGSCFVDEARRWKELWEEWTDFGLSVESLFVYTYNPSLRASLDPWSESGKRVLELATERIHKSANDRELRFLRHLSKFFGPDANPIESVLSPKLVGGG